MERNKRLFAAWQDGVVLGHAWWAFAEKRNKKTFRELQRRGEHLGLRRSLEIDLIARLYAGELQAIGIEGGSDAGPIHIPQYYFSRTAEVDWDKETVTAIGKKFYEITVQGEREPGDEASSVSGRLDPRLIEGRIEPVPDILPSEPKPSIEPPNQGERQSPDETLPNELSDKPPNERERKAAEETPPSDRAQPHKPLMGRPPLVPNIRAVVRELIARNEFANLTKGEIERLILRKARERFPTSFPKPDRPSKNSINKALRMEGWPPLSAK